MGHAAWFAGCKASRDHTIVLCPIWRGSLPHACLQALDALVALDYLYVWTSVPEVMQYDVSDTGGESMRPAAVLSFLIILTTPGQVSGSQVLLPALLKLNASATVDIETCFTADSLPYRLTLSNDGLETLVCVSRAGSRHGGVSLGRWRSSSLMQRPHTFPAERAKVTASAVRDSTPSHWPRTSSNC